MNSPNLLSYALNEERAFVVSQVKSGCLEADFTPSLDHAERKKCKVQPGQILCCLSVFDLAGSYRTWPFLVNLIKDDVPVFSKLLSLLPPRRMPDNTYLDRWMASNPKPQVPPPLSHVDIRSPLERWLGITERNHVVKFKMLQYEFKHGIAEGYLRMWENSYQMAQREAEGRRNPPDPPPPHIPFELKEELNNTRSVRELLKMKSAEPLSVNFYRKEYGKQTTVKTFAKDLQKNFAFYNGYIWRSSKDLSSDEWKLLIEKKERKFDSMMESLRHRASGKVQRIAVPDEVRLEVWRRDEGKCVKCGGREKLEFDHIVPVAMGGSNTTRNVELLCQNCNRTKGCTIA